MRARLSTVFLPILSLLIVAACGREEPPRSEEQGGGGTAASGAGDLDVASPSYGIYQALRATGNTVQVSGDASRPFLEPKGKIFRLGGGDVEVYEFESKEETDAAAAKIGADGIVAGEPQWSATPNFYRTEKVIVLYLGDDQSVRDALELAIGPRFAGG